MDKHTPGPWSVAEDGSTYKRLTIHSVDKSWGMVATVRGVRTHPETQANARLIAAAPLLLDSLTQAAAALAVIANRDSHPGLADHDNLASVKGFALEAFCQAKAALKAAQEG